MTLEEVREYYGNCHRFAKRTRMSSSSFLNWVTSGYVPIMSQHKLEILTEGDLIARISDTPFEVKIKDSR